ncbi:hypothetical protein [Candidatus Nitrosotalea okcheonensis]|nr:hypothetical protein [Candidatus Nitrosotalea okcheonensis]MDE1831506.1 hypothetical protein [Nitrososphaerota archaeon]
MPQNAFSTSSPIQLNKKIFSWTDRVYITIYAPDFNSDPNIIDEIGVTADDKITVSTSGHSIPYRLVETGPNTGIFSGYVTLTGDPALKGSTGVDGQGTNPTGIQSTCSPTCGPTNGFLPSSNNDGVTVSFEYNRNEVVTGSGTISWNQGSIQWLQSSYPVNSQAIVQITDPDMNLNPGAIDKFDTSVWSDSDSGGINLTMTETGPNTGIFQGTVYLTTDLRSAGSRLHVSPGDTITAEYTDNTLPLPYSPSDQLRLTATTTAGTVLAPLEQAALSNARIVDSTGKVLSKVNVNQQIQVVSDVTNQQKRDQPFAYLVQIQDNNGITVSLSWITGSMTPGQTLSLGQSWLPSTAGTYTAQIFVWQSISSPNALAPSLPLQIRVE